MNIKDVKRAYVPEQSEEQEKEKSTPVKDDGSNTELSDEMNFTEDEAYEKIEDSHTSVRSGKIFSPNESRYIIVTFASNAHMLREKLSAYKKLLKENVDDIVNELFGPQ